MNVENNHTAETESEQTTNGSETITIQTTLGDEDEDVHKCGRCQSEFSTLEAFIQHKLQHNCKRVEEAREADSQEAEQEVTAANGRLSSEVKTADGASSDELLKTTHDPLGRGCRKKTVSLKATDHSDGTEGSLSDNADGDNKPVYKVTQEGRYICQLCDKSFKTTNILRTHMKTHSDQKNFSCDLCGTSFRTKGSLIRHNRRHTDERPYRCTLCGQSFRESGALTRHLKALTPCTEKIRFVQYKEILVSKDGMQKGRGHELLSCYNHYLHSNVYVSDALLSVFRQQEAGDGLDQTFKLYTCPHCNRSFKGLNYFRFHVKGHLGYKPFKCTLCHKEFLTGYLLKKHMEIHLSERRYKCGECGKLYKTIGHVREHMRAHSDERPYRCARCSKGYKTKNALQVHQRTHDDDKPYVCQFCLRGFREKGSLVRHIRHHTGEKPFKCPKCGRGFAEHGTLNRHMRAKGGCQKDDSSEHPDVITEEKASVDGLATAAMISEDPHAVLVEFSSVVADTQEYIIKTQTEEEVQEEAVTFIQDSQNEMGNQIMKVVQQIVSQSHGGGGTGSHQIIVRNMAMNEDSASISDCGDTITIATPESLTEQVALTLASAISDGTLLATAGTVEMAGGTVTMVTTEEAVEEEVEVEEGIQMVQQEEYVITSPEEVEIQTVIV
ncbi:transcription factor E4F1 [Anarrhichthys ocellatus]|uniref:transcription factor E4F1 n=1 Tax=Anarrhichthys ocellatus TaxID=433405 RepID=UPI0012ECC731|nr:transcription factor E4F1-like [Anarrhichthys ocellatus]